MAKQNNQTPLRSWANSSYSLSGRAASSSGGSSRGATNQIDQVHVRGEKGAPGCEGMNRHQENRGLIKFQRESS